MEHNASMSNRPFFSGNWSADLIVFASSTGGPRAVQTVLESLPGSTVASIAPIVVAQHMPEGFTRAFARRLDRVCSLTVVEASHNSPVRENTVYICPAGYMTYVVRTEADTLVLQVEEADLKKLLYLPSADVLFESAVRTGARVLAVVLTGMGSDGQKGAGFVKESGGVVITESEQSAVIYGMPKAVYQAGLSDLHLSIDQIGPRICQLVSSHAPGTL